MCFTIFGEALYMMSSSELQRVSLAANKVVVLEGTIDLQPLNDPEEDEHSLVHRHDNREEDDDDEDDNKSELIDATLATVTSRGGPSGDQLAAVAKSISPANGMHSPSSALDVTTTSSMGDMTLDSIRDHLNSSTITTLHKQTTEEVVGESMSYPYCLRLKISFLCLNHKIPFKLIVCLPPSPRNNVYFHVANRSPFLYVSFASMIFQPTIHSIVNRDSVCLSVSVCLFELCPFDVHRATIRPEHSNKPDHDCAENVRDWRQH